MKRATVHTAHKVPDRPPIQVQAGQEVAVGERDDEWPEFIFVTTTTGSGWVPTRHLTITGPGRAVVHTAYDTTELPAAVGDTLDVIVEDLQSGWVWCRSRQGDEGWVPVRALDLEP
jgi:hypothetical protein